MNKWSRNASINDEPSSHEGHLGLAITDGPAVKGPVHTRLPCGQRSPGSAPSETADQPLSPGVLTSKGFSFGLPGLPSVSKELMIRKCCYSRNPGKTAPAVRPRLGSLAPDGHPPGAVHRPPVSGSSQATSSSRCRFLCLMVPVQSQSHCSCHFFCN